MLEELFFINSGYTFNKFNVLAHIVKDDELTPLLFKGEGVSSKLRRYFYDEARITFPDFSLDIKTRDISAVNIHTFKYRKIFYTWAHVDLLSDVKLNSELPGDYQFGKIWGHFGRAVLHIGDAVHPMMCFQMNYSYENLPTGLGSLVSRRCKYCLHDTFDHTVDFRNYSSANPSDEII